jgi:hypothetical protein
MSMYFQVRPPSLDTLQTVRRRSLQQFATAVARSADDTAKAAQNAITDKMRETRLGKISRAIRYTSDYQKNRVPDIGLGVSDLKAGAVVWNRDPSERTQGTLDAYTNGEVTILPKHGRWLAIATDEIPAKVGRFRMTPYLYERSGLDRKIGPLQFIQGKKSGNAFLIVHDVQVNAAHGFGRARRIPKTGRISANKKQVGFIIAFILIRVTRRSERLNPKQIFRDEFTKLPDRIRARLRSTPRSGKEIASWSGSFTI